MTTANAKIHRCLMNQDIICNIISYLYPHNGALNILYNSLDKTGGRSSLAALARTSKEVFLEPCLNALWKHLLSLAPILHCFNEHHKPLGSDESGPKLSPCRFRDSEGFKALNWERFDFYAWRVRTLWTDADDNVSEDVLFELSMKCRSAPILPRLQSIVWYHSEREKWPFLRLFCGAWLQELTIHPGRRVLFWPYYRSSLHSMMSTLDDSCLQLKKLAIVKNRESTMDEDELEDEASCMVESMRSLESFACGFYLTQSAFRHLSSMPALRSINISNTCLIQPLVSSEGTESLYFPSLETVTISNTPLAEAIGFLRSLGRHPFRCIALSCLDCAGRGQLEALFRVLDAICDPDALRVLTLVLCPNGQDCDNRPISDDLLAPDSLSWLQSATKLEECSILSCAIAWDDDTLEGVASAWSNIALLELRSNPGPSPDCIYNNKITTRGLLSIAKQYHSLEKLSLDVRWDDIEWAVSQERPQWTLENNSTSWFAFGAVPAKSERAIATFLKSLFPNLSKVSNRRVSFWLNYDQPECHLITEDEYMDQFTNWLPEYLALATFPYPDAFADPPI